MGRSAGLGRGPGRLRATGLAVCVPGTHSHQPVGGHGLLYLWFPEAPCQAQVCLPLLCWAGVGGPWGACLHLSKGSVWPASSAPRVWVSGTHVRLPGECGAKGSAEVPGGVRAEEPSMSEAQEWCPEARASPKGGVLQGLRASEAPQPVLEQKEAGPEGCLAPSRPRWRPEGRAGAWCPASPVGLPPVPPGHRGRTVGQGLPSAGARAPARGADKTARISKACGPVGLAASCSRSDLSGVRTVTALAG